MPKTKKQLKQQTLWECNPPKKKPPKKPKPNISGDAFDEDEGSAVASSLTKSVVPSDFEPIQPVKGWEKYYDLLKDVQPPPGIRKGWKPTRTGDRPKSQVYFLEEGIGDWSMEQKMKFVCLEKQCTGRDSKCGDSLHPLIDFRSISRVPTGADSTCNECISNGGGERRWQGDFNTSNTEMADLVTMFVSTVLYLHCVFLNTCLTRLFALLHSLFACFVVNRLVGVRTTLTPT